jgi:hypothetical protein
MFTRCSPPNSSYLAAHWITFIQPPSDCTYLVVHHRPPNNAYPPNHTYLFRRRVAHTQPSILADQTTLAQPPTVSTPMQSCTVSTPTQPPTKSNLSSRPSYQAIRNHRQKSLYTPVYKSGRKNPPSLGLSNYLWYQPCYRMGIFFISNSNKNYQQCPSLLCQKESIQCDYWLKMGYTWQVYLELDF